MKPSRKILIKIDQRKLLAIMPLRIVALSINGLNLQPLDDVSVCSSFSAHFKLISAAQPL